MSNGYIRKKKLLVDIRMFTEVSTIHNEQFHSTLVPGKRGPISKIENGPKTILSESISDTDISKKNVMRHFNDRPRCCICKQTGHILRDCVQP